MGKYGVRELAYFLSRFPKATGLGEWYYNPRIDAWMNPVAARAMKVEAEEGESIARCLYLGIKKEKVRAFIDRHMKGDAQ